MDVCVAPFQFEEPPEETDGDELAENGTSTDRPPKSPTTDAIDSVQSSDSFGGKEENVMGSGSFRSIAVFFAIAFSAEPIASGQCEVIAEDQRLSADFVRHSREAGTMLAMAGDHLLLGTDNGVVWAYRHDGIDWHEVQRIQFDSADRIDVAVDGDVAAFGIPFHDDAKGRVEVWRWDGVAWGEEAYLVPSHTGAPLMGWSVDLDGDLLAVGAIDHEIGGEQIGAVYVFRGQAGNWLQEATLTDPGGERGDRLGLAVSVGGGVVAGGTPDANDLDGGVFLWRFDGVGWSFEHEIVGNLPPFNSFGAELELHGGELWVGVPHDDTGAFNAGAVYRYADAADWPELGRIYASDPQDSAQFGAAIARAGNHAAVGAPFWDGSVPLRGALYVLAESGGQWLEEDRLRHSDGESGDRFGHAVGISGSRVAGSAPGADPQGVAAAFEYDGSQWANRVQLEPSDAHRAGFGTAIAARDGLALVSFVPDDLPGSVRVLRHDGRWWNEESLLEAADPLPGLRFGAALALDPPWAAVGVPEIAGATFAGEVALFHFDGVDWLPAQVLQDSSGNDGDEFGDAISLAGDLLCVGAPGRDDGAVNAGAVYVYRLVSGIWTLEAKLLAANPAAGDRFGRAVHHEADTIVVGTPLADHPANDAGAVELFQLVSGNWEQQAVLFDPAGAARDHFGTSVRLEAPVLAVGVPDRDRGAVRNVGTVELFREIAGNWTHEASLLVPGREGRSVRRRAGPRVRAALRRDSWVAGWPGERGPLPLRSPRLDPVPASSALAHQPGSRPIPRRGWGTCAPGRSRPRQ